MRMRLCCGSGLGILVALLASGCGPKLASVQGKVTLDGQPVSQGIISFQPESGTSAPSAGGELVDGKYVLPREIIPGAYRVEISSWQETGKTVNGPFGVSIRMSASPSMIR